MADLNIDARDLPQFLYIFPDTDEDGVFVLNVICNFCVGSRKKYFYKGDPTELPSEENWIAEVIEHVIAEHSGRLGGK